MSASNITKNRGLTLVELLATIMIIAVLMALLMPAISRIRGIADSTKCVSNLRQIGLGISLYAADNDDFLPGPLGGAQHAYYSGEDAINNNGGRLATYLQGYIAPARPTGADFKSEVFICPALARQIKPHKNMTPYIKNGAAITPSVTMGVSSTTYFPFGKLGNNNQEPVPTQRISTLQGLDKKQLSTIWAFADLDGESPPNFTKSSSTPKQFPDHPVHPVYSATEHATPAGEAHKAGYRNALFFDFHVGRVNIADNSAK